MSKLDGWWPLNESDGDARDRINGNDGSLNGGTVRGTAGRAGLQSYSFDGNDDEVNLGDPSELNGTGSRTVALWVKLYDTGAQRLFNNEDSFEGYQLRVNSSGTFQWSISDGGGVQSVTWGQSPNTEQWYHVAGTYDASVNSSSLYVNGENVKSATVNAMANPSGQTASIGSFVSGSGEYANANICDVRVYGEALEALQIKEIYEQGSVDSEFSPTDYEARFALDGDVTDDTGTYSATNNGVTFGSGIRGQRGVFNISENDWIDTTYTSGAGALSISVWVNPNSINTGTSQRIVSTFDGDTTDGSGEDGVFLIDESGGQFRWSVYDSVGDPSIVNFSAVDELTHIVATLDGNGGIEAYKNGVSQGTQTIGSEKPASTNTMAIGRDYQIGQDEEYWGGTIEDVRIYERELTQQEVSELYRWGTFGKDMRKELVNRQ